MSEIRGAADYAMRLPDRQLRANSCRAANLSARQKMPLKRSADRNPVTAVVPLIVAVSPTSIVDASRRLKVLCLQLLHQTQ